MHFLTPIIIAATLSSTLASPVPFNDIEKRWAQGQNEVSHSSTSTNRINNECAYLNLPACYFNSWFQSILTLPPHQPNLQNPTALPITPPLLGTSHPSITLLTDQQKREIHSGLTHRDMTPAWPIARDSNGQEFATATDYRSIEVAEKRDSAVSLMQRFKEFAARVMSGEEKREVDGEGAPVLRPRKAMRYYFTK